MKIIIKTLQGKQLPLDVEETFTVRNLCPSNTETIDQTDKGED